jgi:hypothetical protein
MIPFSALAPVDEAAILVHFQIIFSSFAKRSL